jgi:CRP-like cAMP-binding protein
MTKHLKEEVLIDIYKRVLKKSKFLRENFTEQTINKLCTRIKEKKFVPEEVIIQQGEVASKLIFLLSGSI